MVFLYNSKLHVYGQEIFSMTLVTHFELGANKMLVCIQSSRQHKLYAYASGEFSVHKSTLYIVKRNQKRPDFWKKYQNYKTTVCNLILNLQNRIL